MRTSAPAISTSCSASPSSYPSRARFLTDLTLDPPSATSDEAGPPLLDEDYLILSTIHSAKGQEWKAIYVLNVVDGCIPSDMATGNSEEIEEERRLLYVAMTRAKDTLLLVVPQRFYVHAQAKRGDKHALRGADALHPGPDCWPFRDAVVADGRPLARQRAAASNRPSIWRPACAACGAAPARDAGQPVLNPNKVANRRFGGRGWTGVRFGAKKNANP